MSPLAPPLVTPLNAGSIYLCHCRHDKAYGSKKTAKIIADSLVTLVKDRGIDKTQIAIAVDSTHVINH